MPHVDLSLRTSWTAQGQSRFARPVAAITAIVRRSADAVVGALTHRNSPVPPRIRQDLEIRGLEEQYAKATDLADLERMERAWGRREVGGMANWDWR